MYKFEAIKIDWCRFPLSNTLSSLFYIEILLLVVVVGKSSHFIHIYLGHLKTTGVDPKCFTVKAEKEYIKE